MEQSCGTIYPRRSLRMSYAPMQGTALVDVDTAVSLELVTNVCPLREGALV